MTVREEIELREAAGEGGRGSKKGRKRTSRKEWSGSRSRDSAGYGKDS